MTARAKRSPHHHTALSITNIETFFTRSIMQSNAGTATRDDKQTQLHSPSSLLPSLTHTHTHTHSHTHTHTHTTTTTTALLPTQIETVWGLFTCSHSHWRNGKCLHCGHWEEPIAFQMQKIGPASLLPVLQLTCWQHARQSHVGKSHKLQLAEPACCSWLNPTQTIHQVVTALEEQRH